MKYLRRIVLTLVALFTATALAIGGLFAAWLSGAHIPIATGAPYLRVEKLAPISSADSVGGGPSAPFFVLLVGNDSRPGVGGARGDALHLLGVNPAQHKATMIDIPRDTCFNNNKINVGNTQGPRQQANDVGALTGVAVNYVVDVDFAGFSGLVDGIGGVDVNVPVPMHDSYSGAYFSPGLQHMNSTQALAFSRDRHDFPQSDIVRTHNQGLLILDAMTQLRKQMQNAGGEFKLLALLGQHAQLDGIGIKDLYRLGRTAFSLDPSQIKSINVPYAGTGPNGCLSVAGSAGPLFNDLRDDGVVESADAGVPAVNP
jgi:LCP family protein required for cell wall assembly